jgi:2-polyprenyl-3-methyl-5-hydroxy-6-metoxy-1,4-benzoquinol methylase
MQERVLGELSRSHRAVYGREPLEIIDGIPVFSSADEYTHVYEKIADDHLIETANTGKNPFITQEVWEASEASTAELLSKYARADSRILDVGVSLGRLLERFPPMSRYGMDISMAYLRIAKAKGIEVCLARIEDMPYKEEVFDLVVCTDVLEHVLDLNLCVSKILTPLKRGGFLIVRVPYKENLGSYLHPDYPYHYAHLRNFDEFGLTLFFERVFQAKVIEHTTAGRSLDWTRMKYRLPIGNRIFARAVRLIKMVIPPLGRILSLRLFTPVEINMVIQKTTVTSSS